MPAGGASGDETMPACHRVALTWRQPPGGATGAGTTLRYVFSPPALLLNMLFLARTDAEEPAAPRTRAVAAA